MKFPRLQRRMSIDERILNGLTPRPYYAYCMLNGARLARRLGFTKTSVIEFGVAGGDGLVAAESLAQQIERETGVTIDIYGFDMGSGLPEAKDYRDMPYHWKPGYFEMDEPALRQKLSRSKLVLGPIADTMAGVVAAQNFHEAPISSVFFDLDFYSSTVDAFRIFDSKSDSRLPRVFSYMDDIEGEVELHSNFTGVRGAIADFNQEHNRMKISRLHLNYAPDPRLRASRLMIFHDFSHPLYCRFAGDEQAHGGLPLSRT